MKKKQKDRGPNWRFNPDYHQTIGCSIYPPGTKRPVLLPWGEREGRTTTCKNGMNFVSISQRSLAKLKYGR